MMPAMTVTSDLARRRWLVLAASVVSFFAVGATFFVVPPLVPELVARFGLSNLQVGLLMGAIAVPAVLVAIPLGLAIDRWRSLPAGVGALAVMVAGAVVFATAPSFAVLFAGRLLFGLGGLVVNLLLARLLTTAFAGRELALAMGVFMATYPASMITVYSVHPVLFDLLGWRGELLLLAALAAVALPLYAFAVRGTPVDAPASEPSRPSLHVSPPLAALGGAWMLFFANHASVLTFAPEWAGGGAPALLVVTLVMWVAVIGSPLAGALVDRTANPHLWLMAGLTIQAAALAAMATKLAAPVPAMLSVGVAAALVPTAAYALPGRLVAPERVGFAFGFITALSNLGTIIGPAAAGALLDRAGSWPAIWAALATAAALAALAASRARVRRQSQWR